MAGTTPNQYYFQGLTASAGPSIGPGKRIQA
jgi:hypothetical protein